MNTERLTEILDAYGADPGRWPEAERGEAAKLLARSPELALRRAEAKRLDAVLDAAAAVGDLGLEAAALAARITRGSGNVRLFAKRRNFAGAWPGLAGLAAAAAAGLFVGWLGIGGEYLGYGSGIDNAAAGQAAGQAPELGNGFVPTEGDLW